jgi:cobalamin biosynthesis protein CbiD
MYDDRDEYLEYVARDEAEQAKWEEEAHYWHTVMALVDLIEEYGQEEVMADVANTLAQRASEASPEPMPEIAGLPMPDLSFLSIRTGA